MQVPERLALIGGGILLSSTLVFTLKSQASSIIPQVSNSVGSIYQDITDTQAAHGALSFKDAFQNAQQHHWRTGTWGTAPYYIDGQDDMYIGSGSLQGRLYDILGSDEVHQVKTLNFRGNVRAPQDSTYLLAGVHDRYADNNTSITQINGLDKMDTSQVTNMTSMFANDTRLQGLDLSHWDTHQVNSLYTTFNADYGLKSLDVSHWDTTNVHTMDWAFFSDHSLTDLDLYDWHVVDPSLDHAFSGMSGLQSLDISNFENYHSNMNKMFGGDWTSSASDLHQLSMEKTRLNRVSGLPNATWKDGDRVSYTVVLNDDGLHPGTWVRQ